MTEATVATPLLRRKALRRRVFMKSFGLFGFLAFFGLSVLLVGLSVFVYLGTERLSRDEVELAGEKGDALQTVLRGERELRVTLPCLIILAAIMACIALIIVTQIVHSIVVANRLIGSNSRKRRAVMEAAAGAKGGLERSNRGAGSDDLGSALLRNSRLITEVDAAKRRGDTTIGADGGADGGAAKAAADGAGSVTEAAV